MTQNPNSNVVITITTGDFQSSSNATLANALSTMEKAKKSLEDAGFTHEPVRYNENSIVLKGTDGTMDYTAVITEA